MVYVAKQMQERGMNLPLMIGGATTSKAHTAVKIEPNYSNDAVVYVADASRAVGVATTLVLWYVSLLTQCNSRAPLLFRRAAARAVM